MWVLMGFFFVMPSAFRGARDALKNKENDVKDWLPSDFPETAELDWFAEHFAGESFILATWPGCNENDQRLRLLEEKLLRESADYRDQLQTNGREKEGLTQDEITQRVRAREIGEELGLMLSGQSHEGWGGLDEKWLSSKDGTWYFITPGGRLHRWDEPSNVPLAAIRGVKRLLGKFELEGQFIAAFGAPSDERTTNPFYNDPALICAPLFETVQTGVTIAADLASPGGALWPVDLTDESYRQQVAMRRAEERLAGSLFAPAVPRDFDWNVTSIAGVLSDANASAPRAPKHVDEAAIQSALVEWAKHRWPDPVLDTQDAAEAAATPGARLAWAQASIRNAPESVQTEAWYALFDSFDREAPARLTCVLVTLTDLAKDKLAYALGRGVLDGVRGRFLVLAEQCGIEAPPPPSATPPPFDRTLPPGYSGMPPLRMGGPPVDNMAIDEEGTVTLVRLIGYCVLLGVVLAYLCFRSIKITIMLFVVGGSAAMLSMAVVGWTGGRVDAILLSMPSLVYVLGLSGAIHVINYYRDETRLGGTSGAAARALAHAAMPCTLAAVTTAIGLASLFTSNLTPISGFGLYSAIGVIATLGILFSYLPAALEVFAPRVGKLPKNDGRDDPPQSDEDPPAEDRPIAPEQAASRLAHWWAAFGTRVVSKHALVSVACLAGLVTATFGLLKIETSVQLLKLFDEEARILKDYAWLESNFGKLVPMEIVVRMPEDIQQAKSSDVAALNMLERIEMVSRIRQVVTRTLGREGLDKIGQASSMDTFLPPLPKVESGYSITRANYDRAFRDGFADMLDSDYVALEQQWRSGDPMASGDPVGETNELWRLSLRVSALSEIDYGLFIDDLRTAVHPVTKAYEVRHDVLHRLSRSEGARDANQTVLVLGSQKPLGIDEAPLLDEQRQIATRACFLSVLSDVLDAENFRRVVWIDPSAADAKLKPSDPNWERMMTRVDMVIDVMPTMATAVIPEGVATIRPQIASIPSVSSGRDVSTAERLLPTVVYTGVVPVVYKAQRTLLGSLVESIGLAFVLIACVMIVLLNPGAFPFAWLQPSHLGHGLAAGMVSMVPNVFPVLLVFGVMGHLGFKVDIGTMMTASVAMGVAVDDTIHFLSWYRSFLESGADRKKSLIETYRRVGPAMTQTTIVGGLGLFVFALSTFTPTQRFGTLMLVLLAAALVGDLLLLPALLAGPLGRFFKPRHATASSSRPTAHGASGQDPRTRRAGGADGNSDIESVPTQDAPISEVNQMIKLHVPRFRADEAHSSKKE
ncbi:MAG: MMPL family transporter [Planctomycetota bacterium]